MFLKQIFLGVCGVSFGMLVSCGVFTVLVAVGLVTRFAGKTHTGKQILLYEGVICAGTIMGCLITVYPKTFQLGKYMLDRMMVSPEVWNGIAQVTLALFGLFAGMFVGCFAIAIAEMLDAIPIFSRRVGFRHGLGLAILAISLGKMFGSLFYFSQHIFLYGGQ